MMDVVSDALKSLEVPNDHVHLESFEAGKTSPKEIFKVGTPDKSVTVLLDGDTYDFTVKYGLTVLEAGLKNGIDLPYSCQSGLCTACRGKVLEGKISMEGADGLTDEEIEEGFGLLCIGKAESEQVKIEIC